MEIVASLSQGRTAAAQCGLFTHKSVPVIFEPPCMYFIPFAETVVFINLNYMEFTMYMQVMMRSQVVIPLFYKIK